MRADQKTGRGHRVALLARRADRIQALADELGNGAIAIEADVTDRDSIVAAAERVQQELGGADILVNNAGVMLTAPFASDQREEQRRMVETNLLGAMTATEVFLDQLRANGGDLVNISSVAGRVAPAGFAAYAATKWGINGWSGGAARRATTRHPGHGHRTRRHRDGTLRAHHPRRQQKGRQGLPRHRHPPGRHRRRHRLRRQPATARDAQRDPRAPNRAGHVTRPELAARPPVALTPLSSFSRR
jgi:NAD(P)-dependent dehydrogenase (short-subunit alcohol dehydrogenase family)